MTYDTWLSTDPNEIPHDPGEYDRFCNCDECVAERERKIDDEADREIDDTGPGYTKRDRF